MFEYLKGQRVLITGGAGTVGHALIEEFNRIGQIRYAVASRNEATQFKLKQRFPLAETIWCDIKDIYSLERAFLFFRPNVVIHAAAVKVVPTAEKEMLSTFETNALGTYNVMKCCISNGVST